MEIFSIICLVIIMLGIQHLLNWMWRGYQKIKGELIVPTVMLTVLSIIPTWYCIYYMILWGKNLI